LVNYTPTSQTGSGAMYMDLYFSAGTKAFAQASIHTLNPHK